MNAHSILLAALENSRLVSGQLGGLGDALRAIDQGQANSETAMRQALEAIALGRQAAGQAAAIAGELAANQAAVAAALVELERLLRPLPVTRSGMPYLFGFREPANSYEVMTQPGGKYDQIEAWLRPLDLYPAFLGKDLFNGGWDKLMTNYVLGHPEDPRGQLQGIYDRGARPLLAVPLMITSAARQYDRGAAGDWDAPHRAIARRVGAIAQGRGLLLRLGWEVNEGYPWSWIEASADQEIPDDPTW